MPSFACRQNSCGVGRSSNDCVLIEQTQLETLEILSSVLGTLGRVSSADEVYNLPALQ
jgi:hypothetical protein